MLEFFLFYTALWILGLFFGSFLNVVIDRMPFGRSIIFPSSHCPHCKHKLSFLDLIPLFSFFFLHRQCRYCHAEISWYYPVVELFTGFLFVLTAYIVIGSAVAPFLEQFSHLSYIIYLLVIISLLTIVFFVDLKYGIIPFRIVIISLCVVSVRYLTFIPGGLNFFINYLLTAIIIFLFFLLLFLLSRGRAIGFGDVFFSLLMGYLLGFPKIILGVYTAFLTGAFISLILVIANKKKLKGGTIPFGPFLVFGTILSLFWGDYIINNLLIYLHVY